MALELTPEQLVSLRAEARRRFQVMIDYIKAQVGPGREYANGLVRVVISERGCFYEFVDMPEEFSGAVGSGVNHEFVSTARAVELAAQLHEITQQVDPSNTRELSLLIIYQWDGVFRRDDSFVFHHSLEREEESPLFSLGNYQPGALPLFLKLKGDSDLLVPVFGGRKGVLFFVANLTDQHLLVRIPHHGPGFTDLTELPASARVH
jgi:hypothetical protein